MCVCARAHTCLVIESCPTLCEPKDCSLPELQSKKPELGVNRNISKATTTNLYPRLHLLLLLHFFFPSVLWIQYKWEFLQSFERQQHLSEDASTYLKVYYQAIIFAVLLELLHFSVQSFVVAVLFLRFLEMRKVKMWSHGKIHKLESVRAKVQSLKSKTYSLYHKCLRCTIFPGWE